MFTPRRLFLFSLLVSAVAAQSDASRLGSFYTTLPIYRSGAGTNTVSIGLGAPAQPMNLTVSTNVEYLMVATEDCIACVRDVDPFQNTESSSHASSPQALDYTSIYPAGSDDTLEINGILATEHITDRRGDQGTARPVVLANTIKFSGEDAQLSDGTTGFWGMGIDQSSKGRSLLPSMLAGTAASNTSSFVVGMDVAQITTTSRSAGNLHWGGAPVSAYEGSFNWLRVNTTVAGSWGIGIDRMRVGSTVIDGTKLYGSLDPGYDAIYVPDSVARAYYTAVSGAVRDKVDLTRWNLPCNTNISMTITIASHEYSVDASQLVQRRDRAGQTCWGAVVGWTSGSTPDRLGEVRLGTPFMSGIYTVLYYDEVEQLVGLAGKPGSVNALNVVTTQTPGKVNGKLAGGLIGGLLALLIIGLVICYGRNRSTFQSIWLRSVRQQYRMQQNAMIRAHTIPPAMAVPPVMVGPMVGPMGPGLMGMQMGVPMGAPMGGPMMPGMMGQPMGMGMGMGMGMHPGMNGMHPGMYPGMQSGYNQPPPKYQPPMQQVAEQRPLLQPSQLLAQESLHAASNSRPLVVEHKPQGFYSPRHHYRSSTQQPPAPHQQYAPIAPSVPMSRSDFVQPHLHPGYVVPPQAESKSSRVRFVAVGTARRHAPSSSSKSGKSGSTILDRLRGGRRSVPG